MARQFWFFLRAAVVVVAFFAMLLISHHDLQAQERPYFVTYSQEMEEPGNLDLETFNVVGNPKDGDAFLGSNLEFEYGLFTWWTTEFYLDGQATSSQSTIFTGFRWENRWRPWLGEHKINPVLYAEFENTAADKTLREIVGHDGNANMLEPNGVARMDKERELELKLILGSNFKGWNLSENFITAKSFAAGEPWEFGYAIGMSRPLKLAASAHECTFCAEKWQAGAELYGGLGDTNGFGTTQTAHYFGPTLNWTAPNGMTIGISPQAGLNSYSIPFLFRFSVSYEIEQIFSRFHHS